MRLFEGKERLFQGRKRDYSKEGIILWKKENILWKRDYSSKGKGKDYSKRRDYQVVSYFSFKIFYEGSSLRERNLTLITRCFDDFKCFTFGDEPRLPSVCTL